MIDEEEEEEIVHAQDDEDEDEEDMEWTEEDEEEEEEEEEEEDEQEEPSGAVVDDEASLDVDEVAVSWEDFVNQNLMPVFVSENAAANDETTSTIPAEATGSVQTTADVVPNSESHDEDFLGPLDQSDTEADLGFLFQEENNVNGEKAEKSVRQILEPYQIVSN